MLQPPIIPSNLSSPACTHEEAGSTCSCFEWIKTFVPYLDAVLSRGVQYVVLTLGKHGACLCNMDAKCVRIVYLPSIASDVQSCGGAGKCKFHAALFVIA